MGTNAIDLAQMSKFIPEDGDRIQSTNHCFKLKKKNRMVNVRKHNNALFIVVIIGRIIK
jgi:hypothetical protein